MNCIIIDDTDKVLIPLCELISKHLEQRSQIMGILCGTESVRFRQWSLSKFDGIQSLSAANETELRQDRIVNAIKDFSYDKDNTRLLIDINLSETQRRLANLNIEPENYYESGSVRLARLLTSENILDKSYIIFYTRPNSLDLVAEQFVYQTKREWRAPIARPEFNGFDQTRYINNLVKMVKAKKNDESKF